MSSGFGFFYVGVLQEGKTVKIFYGCNHVGGHTEKVTFGAPVRLKLLKLCYEVSVAQGGATSRKKRWQRC